MNLGVVTWCFGQEGLPVGIVEARVPGTVSVKQVALWVVVKLNPESVELHGLQKVQVILGQVEGALGGTSDNVGPSGSGDQVSQGCDHSGVAYITGYIVRSVYRPVQQYETAQARLTKRALKIEVITIHCIVCSPIIKGSRLARGDPVRVTGTKGAPYKLSKGNTVVPGRDGVIIANKRIIDTADREKDFLAKLLAHCNTRSERRAFREQTGRGSIGFVPFCPAMGTKVGTRVAS